MISVHVHFFEAGSSNRRTDLRVPPDVVSIPPLYQGI